MISTGRASPHRTATDAMHSKNSRHTNIPSATTSVATKQHTVDSLSMVLISDVIASANGDSDARVTLFEYTI